jgi:prolipoprotein diacylglyceryl transferase
LIGARLGHVLFYQPDYYLARPWEIFMIWQGGLASHGGFTGVLIALYLYVRKYREMSFLELSDRLVIASLPAAALIRLGNVFNSEIVGMPTNIPLGVIFLRVDDVPRHPAMLYEGVAYLLAFCALYFAYWRTASGRFPGRILGLALASSFFTRFMIEFVKANQAPFEQSMILNMGQLLSIPFIVAGFTVIYLSAKKPV